MALDRVDLTAEVLLTCTTHAFTTEAEEIMGLLLGDVVRGADGAAVCKIWIAIPQVRVDRRKDRVETSPQQMADCTEMAERYTKSTGVRTRVIGWYHSHPHITVLPSHIDVRTQATYQMLDQGFIGLIFSCFNRDASLNAENFQVTAFQSMESLGPSVPDAMSQHGSLAEFDAHTQQALRAAHQAELEKSHGQWERREVSMSIMPSTGLPDGRLTGYLSVQQILFAEERNMFSNAVKEARSDATAPVGSSALATVHHNAAYQLALCRLLDTCLAPSINVMSMKLAQNKIQSEQLQAENQRMKDLLEAQRGSVPATRVSPTQPPAVASLSSQYGQLNLGPG